ncbi:MAG: hypothetical protein LBI02_02890 [Opitutaceae bacterium]|nr:hypothetical protein [Opitutaceae bacterium]
MKNRLASSSRRLRILSLCAPVAAASSAAAPAAPPGQQREQVHAVELPFGFCPDTGGGEGRRVEIELNNGIRKRAMARRCRGANRCAGKSARSGRFVPATGSLSNPSSTRPRCFLIWTRITPSKKTLPGSILKNTPGLRPNGKAGTSGTRKPAGKTNAPTFAKASCINQNNEHQTQIKKVPLWSAAIYRRF